MSEQLISTQCVGADGGLKDAVWDSVADARSSLRIGNAKDSENGNKLFFVSFVMSLDPKTYAAISALADKHARSTPRILKRWVKEAFKCFLSDEYELQEPKP
jgi:hypothetical protein